MKKIVVIMTALLSLGFFAQADSSDNVVGYAKVTATGGELTLVALNFTPASTTVADLIGDQLPSGSVLHIWDKVSSAYVTVNKGGRSGWGAATIDLGDAFWIQASGSSTHEVILAGDVNVADQNSTTIAAGIEATGLFFPVEMNFGDTSLASTLGSGSVVHFWDNASQAYTTFNKGGRSGWSATAQNTVVGPTTGFWVQSTSEVSWNETRPFSF